MSENGQARSKTTTATKILAAIGAGTLVLKGTRYGMEVFGPTRPFRLQPEAETSPESEHFADRLSCVVDALLYKDTIITVLRNGTEFYPAELEAIESGSL
jgi:hypothetical protein